MGGSLQRFGRGEFFRLIGYLLAGSALGCTPTFVEKVVTVPVEKQKIVTREVTAIIDIVVPYGSTPVPDQKQEQQPIKKSYLENLTNYKEISVDEWRNYYPQGLILPQNSEPQRKLAGKPLISERVMVGERYGSIKEYVNLRDTATGEVYFTTIDAKSGITEKVESATEVDQKIIKHESELFSSVLLDLESNRNAIPTVEKIIESENPYVVGDALDTSLKNVEVIEISNGEVSPFLDYSSRLNKNKLEFELSGAPESAVAYLLIKGIGESYTIPYSDGVGLIVGEKLAEGKIRDTPTGTKTNVKVSYEVGSDTVNVSGSFGDSVLTRLSRYTYYSVKAGRALPAEKVPPPLREYKYDADVDPEKTLRTVSNYLADKNKEGERREKQRQTDRYAASEKQKQSQPKIIGTTVMPIEQVQTRVPQAIQTQLPRAVQTAIPQIKEKVREAETRVPQIVATPVQKIRDEVPKIIQTAIPKVKEIIPEIKIPIPSKKK
ncbi:MAG: hypothetical protein HYW24_04555 [Candidatus Aenigmarchaeota archaeon]|nr:hypothetical protein [Candidatus Aenigmarchaeota archaeon]